MFKLVTVNEVKGVVPPTAPVSVTVPVVPPVRVKLCAPLIVLEKLMLAPVTVPPAFVVSAATVPVNATAPVIPIVPPDVVRLPPKLIKVDPV